ncbi:hypothetical protein HJC23_010898 [Cyclotella cryptica]|uniref:SET domain-containing protein n=1 Tax=Cyclotella cryptica TaxID=29204 RepID=A0ABD3Q9X9_9STRA|eukprot:CCRYP_007537-RA/>CCRYP_007537-RA protein AED:0.03 eAED:0.03 QI:179/1/1/1/1/1/2/90/451
MAPLRSIVGKFAHAAFTLQPGHRHTTLHKALPSSTSETAALHGLSEMCRLFQATPENNLYLDASPLGRGVFVKDSVSKGDVILSIPISSCFRDDEPPDWFERFTEDDDVTDYERYDPSAWAIRLVASLLDMDLDRDTNNEDLKRGRELWKSMLPDKNMLRASLPVHWNEELLLSTKCTALEVAVDNAFFSRGNAVLAVSDKLGQFLNDRGGFDEDELKKKCHDALDMVQTRACRVERTCEDGIQWGPPLRVLAPIFDFINHASAKTTGRFTANAEFGIEGETMGDIHDAKLVVRALKDLRGGEEVLIDYGDSARPAWKCLNSYGFVPIYDPKSDIVEDGFVENVAELWMNGLRFEVDPYSIPFDLVEVAGAQAMLDGTENNSTDEPLSPSVVKAITKRSSEAALHMLLVSDLSDKEDTPEYRHSASLAASLRKSQYQVLDAFTENLKAIIF